MLDEILENAQNHRRQVRTVIGGEKPQVIQISTQLGLKRLFKLFFPTVQLYPLVPCPLQPCYPCYRLPEPW
jgi:hypothetical protein